MRRIVIFIAVATVLMLGLIALIPRGDSSRETGATTVVTNSRRPVREARAGKRAADARELADIEAPSVSSNSPNATNLYGRLDAGELTHVSREQLEAYLASRGRNVEALLGALRASGGDDELLKEAKEKFPNDPRVQFAAAFRTDSPEERRQCLEKFKESAPENALANYLLAGEQLKSGHTEQALQELAAATGKPDFQNYLLDFVQNTEEAYQAAGYSSAEAKGLAMTGALLPELAALKQMSKDVVDLAKRYQQTGDETSARALQNMALSLGQRFDQSPQFTLIQNLVGISIERIALSSMNPNATYGDGGQTVQNRLDALTAQRNESRNLVRQTDPILNTMSDQSLSYYYDRIKLYGDYAALRWVASQVPQPPQPPK